MSRAWVSQDYREKLDKGTEGASWRVEYRDLDGVRRVEGCGPGKEGKKNAQRLRQKIEAELICGTHGSRLNKSWAEFRERYEREVLSSLSSSARRQALMSLGNFERLCRPKKCSALNARTVSTFRSMRSKEPRRYRRSDKALTRKRTKPYADPGVVSVASVNADLRNLKAALAVAQEWGFIEAAPRVKLLKQPKKLPRYVKPDHFALLYAACDHARLPIEQGYLPADWWRALLVFIFQATGWRIGQALALRRDDLDLAAGTALTQADVAGNKAREDRLFALHPLALEHLKRLPGFGPLVFPWPHDERTLSLELERLCRMAGIPKYGWHNLRKGFGTLNAPRLKPSELQHLMQHASLQTTLTFYANPLAEQQEALGKLNVPDVLKTG